jgi:hypothetical protein
MKTPSSAQAASPTFRPNRPTRGEGGGHPQPPVVRCHHRFLGALPHHVPLLAALHHMRMVKTNWSPPAFIFPIKAEPRQLLSPIQDRKPSELKLTSLTAAGPPASHPLLSISQPIKGAPSTPTTCLTLCCHFLPISALVAAYHRASLPPSVAPRHRPFPVIFPATEDLGEDH